MTATEVRSAQVRRKANAGNLNVQLSGARRQQQTAPLSVVLRAFASGLVLFVFLLLSNPANAAVKRHVPLGKFGGSNGPQLSVPTALAIDPATHDLYVVEQSAHAISRWHGDGTPDDFSALAGNKIEGLEFPDFFEAQIAIAPAGAPGGTAGDIYVARGSRGPASVFSSSGELLGELTESSVGPMGEVCGVAIDQAGDLYLGDYGEGVHKFVPSHNPPTAADNTASFSYPEACGVASGAGPSAAYLFASSWSGFGGSGVVGKLDAMSGAQVEQIASASEDVLASDPDSGVLLIGSAGKRIDEYDASGPSAVLQSSIATEGAPHGLAVDPGSGRIYVSEAGSSRISIFSAYAHLPEVRTTAASDRAPTGVRLNGEVNPETEPLTECYFEYGPTTEYGQTAPCFEPDAAEVGAGEMFVPVHADVSGLETTQTYHYRLVAANDKGWVEGSDKVVGAAGPGVSSTTVNHLSSSSARLEGEVNPAGHPASYYFQFLTESGYLANGDSFEGSIAPTSVPAGGAQIGSGSRPVSVSEQIAGLAAATPYRARLVATGGGVTVVGPTTSFTTYGAGVLGLPDDRAYEQVSPVDKNGGNVQGNVDLIQAASEGGATTFYSQTGIPGGEGAQEFPLFMASRSVSYWTTQGLLPPQAAGPFAIVLGWPENLSRDYVTASQPAGVKSVYERSTSGAGLRPIFESAGPVSFAGASADGTISLFEAKSDVLPGAAGPGKPNLYIWDANSRSLRLASVLNDGEAPPEGAFAGGYEWLQENTSVGGAGDRQYSAAFHALAADGSRLYFTGAGTGRLYVRLNPERPQSPLGLGGECTVPTDACTLEASASEKTNGSGSGGGDPAGNRPAAFMAATPTGGTVFFTSPEKLTNNATTAPEATPEIARAEIGGGANETEFLAATASGLATGGGYLYWADGTTGTIGRAKLNGAGAATEVEDDFITGIGKPEYVAVNSEHLFWTNAAGGGEGRGTIGRAKLNGAGAATEIEDDFITGASDPQGIGVDASYVFWANAGTHAIARAEIDGSSVDQALISTGAETPAGVTADSSHVYWTANHGAGISFVVRAEVDGSGEAFQFDGAKLAGITLEGGHVYWVRQSAQTIGRAEADLSSVESEFITGVGDAKGVAADPEHLYWSIGGEVKSNQGDDLYRFDATASGGDRLTDLTVDESASDPNGAEVQGVLGTGDDGSYVYFAANGVLASGASKGTCRRGDPTTALGHCSLYLWHGGAITFIAPLDLEVAQGSYGSDAWNWTPFSGVQGTERGSRVSADGRTLVFRSQEQLTTYDNHGQPEFYRYSVGSPVRCLTCDPTGAPPLGPATMRSVQSLGKPQGPAPILTRNLSADGHRFFFESPDKLVSADVNGDEGCPVLPVSAGETQVRACQDVYEWEAPDPSNPTDTCSTGSSAYVAAAEGCIFLVSTGTSAEPSFFADASFNGDDAFFFTSQSLVAQDRDELQDVYDARVGGGLAAQNRITPQPCTGEESCRSQSGQPPSTSSPGTSAFHGPGNPVPAKHCKMGKVRRHGRCVRHIRRAHRGHGHKHKGKGGRHSKAGHGHRNQRRADKRRSGHGTAKGGMR